MKTLFLLQYQFDGRAQVPLTELCGDLLGLGEAEAKRQASLQVLPFPVFRLGSQKTPWLVSLPALAEYIDKQQREAEKDWFAMNTV